MLTQIFGDVTVTKGLSNRVLVPITLPANTDTVVFVYDIDKIANLKGNKILDSETLKEKISILHY